MITFETLTEGQRESEIKPQIKKNCGMQHIGRFEARWETAQTSPASPSMSHLHLRISVEESNYELAIRVKVVWAAWTAHREVIEPAICAIRG
jgi:hypothetical protein